jgi:acyl carrier protein
MSTDPRLPKVSEILVSQLGNPKKTIEPHHDLQTDLGADSLDCIELVIAFEEEFDIEVEDDVYETGKISTVQHILDHLNNTLGPAEPIDGILCLTEDQFVNRYQPYMAEDNVLRQYEWKTDRAEMELAVEQNRCWTMVDDDNGDPCIVPGNRVVNRQFNIVTRYPLENPDWIVQVQDPDVSPRVLCDVEWDFAGEEEPVDMPKQVIVRLFDVEHGLMDVTEHNSSEIADFISDHTGWCVESFNYRMLQPGEEVENAQVL